MAKSISRIQKVKIDKVKDGEVKEDTIIITKAPLGQWKKITDSLQTLLELLPKVLEEKGLTEKEELEQYFENMTQQDAMMLLPDMMDVALEETMKLLAIGTDKDAKYIEKFVGIDETLDILEAIIEVNGLAKAVEKGKNLMNLLNGRNVQKK